MDFEPIPDQPLDAWLAETPTSPYPPEPQNQPSSPALNWLFVDLNSYFAPTDGDTIVMKVADQTITITFKTTVDAGVTAGQAKIASTVDLTRANLVAFLNAPGTTVADARRLCPGIILVEGRHELYVEYHHRVVEAVESCLPVTAVCSIDEMACRLMGRERPLLAAMELGRQVKSRIRERVGKWMRSSVGLATNRYLAKVASDMEKPDGLVALTLDILPEALRRLTLRDLPGIGARTEKRLKERAYVYQASRPKNRLRAGRTVVGLGVGRASLALAARRRLRDGRDRPPEIHQPSTRPRARHADQGEGLGRGPQAAAQGGHAIAIRWSVGEQHRARGRIRCSPRRKHAGEPLRRSFARMARRSQAHRMPGQPDPDRRAAKAVGVAAERSRARASVFCRRAVGRAGPHPPPHFELV